MPVTIPDDDPTTASDVLLLLHVPPPGVPVKVVVCPVHTVERPVIGDGVELTVIAVVVKQPVGNV